MNDEYEFLQALLLVPESDAPHAVAEGIIATNLQLVVKQIDQLPKTLKSIATRNCVLRAASIFSNGAE